MSYATGTTHYNLPQTVGTDKRDWFDTNQAFSDIDEALYGAVQSAEQSASDIAALKSRMDTAESDIDILEGDVSGLKTSVTAHGQSIIENATEINDVRQDTEDMIVAKELTAAQMDSSTEVLNAGTYFRYNDVLYRVTQAIAVGDTIVPNVNCNATNVATEIMAIQPTGTIGELTDLTTTDKSSIVAAINEVNQTVSEVGILADLTTTDKSSAVAAINEVNSTLNDLTRSKVTTMAAITTNPYTAPCDGYLSVTARGVGNTSKVNVQDSAGSTIFFVSHKGTTAETEYTNLFIKKGMILTLVTSATGTGNGANFFGLDG